MLGLREWEVGLRLKFKLFLVFFNPPQFWHGTEKTISPTEKSSNANTGQNKTGADILKPMIAPYMLLNYQQLPHRKYTCPA